MRNAWKPTHPAIQTLLSALIQTTTPVYVVGGVVRDHLLATEIANRRSVSGAETSIENDWSDLDLVVAAPALATARQVVDQLGWAFYPLDETRDVARLVFNTGADKPIVCDIARMHGDSIYADLLARDFTINAMALMIEYTPNNVVNNIASDNATKSVEANQLEDPFHGLEDLHNSILRRVTPYGLMEDPVRLLRAVRFAAQFHLTIEAETYIQMQRRPSTITTASAERIRDELWKALSTSRPDWVIEQLRQLGLLRFVLPEVGALVNVTQSWPHQADVYQHTLHVVRYAAQLRDFLKQKPWDEPAFAHQATKTESSAPERAFNLDPFMDTVFAQIAQEEAVGSDTRAMNRAENIVGFAGHAPEQIASTLKPLPFPNDAFFSPALAMWYKTLQTDVLMGGKTNNTELSNQPYTQQRRVLYQHFGQTVAGGRTRADWLVWLALFHDVGKPLTRTVDEQENRIRFFNHETVGGDLCVDRLKHLRFSRQEIGLVQTVVKAHMRPHHLHASFKDGEISRRARYRFFRDVRNPQLMSSHILGRGVLGIDTVLLFLADYLAIFEYNEGANRQDKRQQGAIWQGQDSDQDDYQSSETDIERVIQHINQLCTFAFSEQDLVQAQPRPLVDGHTLMQQFNLKPGPEIGQLLEQLFEAQAVGEINSRKEAIEFVEKILNEQTVEP